MDEKTPILPLDPSDPPEPSAEPGAPRRRRRAAIVAGVVVFLLVASCVASAFVQIPYYTVSPGRVRETEPLITVTGSPTFPNQGEVDFLTVSIRRSTILEAVVGWLDPTVDVVEEELILGDQDPDENRAENRQMMLDSKTVATVVALEYLGYEVIAGSGAQVLDVQAGTAAEGRLDAGDVVVGVEGADVELSCDLITEVRSREPGDDLTLEVEGVDGDTREVEVTLGSHPDEEARAFLGVGTGTLDQSVTLPFTVDIDSGNVGGPSAGLAFTLGIIDVLTAGDLTGGLKVATTGTIEECGFVGPVGGVVQKTVAARRAGVDLFLVPSVELEEARAVAGDLRVEPVDTLQQALDLLEELGGGLEPQAGDESAQGPSGD